MIANRPWLADTIVGTVFGLFGLVFVVSAMQIQSAPGAFEVVTPRVAPLAVGIAILLCSLALVAQALVRRRSRPEAPTPPAGEEPVLVTDDEPVQHWNLSLRHLMATFALFTGYVFVFIPLGYVLSTFLFLVALTTYFDRQQWVRNVVFAAGFAVVVYLLFDRALRVQLPVGLLG
jgi:putative tricarboxylic transport membrane protein